jgi:hypothetical protein
MRERIQSDKTATGIHEMAGAMEVKIEPLNTLKMSHSFPLISAIGEISGWF